MATGSDQKCLLFLVSHWISFHLDCEDAVPALYNIIYGSRWHSYSNICRFFDCAIRFDAPAALWFAVSDTVSLFRKTLQDAVPDEFNISEASVQEAVKKTYSTALDNDALNRVSVAVHQYFQDVIAAAEKEAASLGGGGRSAEISVASIFTSGMEFAKRKHRRLTIARLTKETTTSSVVWAADSVDESHIVQVIRNECIQAWFDLVAELSESILDRSLISPEGHVTPYSLAQAMLHVDPMRPESSMSKIMTTIFGEEIIVAEQPQLTTAMSFSGNNTNNEDGKSSPVTFSLDDKTTADASSSSVLAGSLNKEGSVVNESNNNKNEENASVDDGGSPRSVISASGGENKTEVGSVASGREGNNSNNNPSSVRSAHLMDLALEATQDSNLPGAYVETYRRRQYKGGDMMLVHVALSKLKMIPLAKFTPPPENNPQDDAEDLFTKKSY